jgi:hypothetical protein
MKTQIFSILLFITSLFFSSCWSFYSPSGTLHHVTAIDLADGVAIAITDPFPEVSTSPADFGSLSSDNLKQANNPSLLDFGNKYNLEENTFKGWWIYGQRQHIFKDEVSLEEWNLEFPNENMEELKNLYLAVCEMEYFPMESKMTGYFKNNDALEEKTFIVTDFEILYIQGCGD